MYKIEVIKTNDGSNTLFVPELNETYHSKHGAATESKHVYIDNGLNFIKEQGFSSIQLLEIGFGTGLNCMLTLDYLKYNPLTVSYTTLEKYPISIEGIVSYLKDNSWCDDELLHLHVLPWEVENKIQNQFTFRKIKTDLHQFQCAGPQFHLIYFDAFAPNKQPDMWTTQVFETLYHSLVEGGALVTYCAQGQFKRNLRSAGFKVETLPGPPFKKEMTRGVKIAMQV